MDIGWRLFVVVDEDGGCVYECVGGGMMAHLNRPRLRLGGCGRRWCETYQLDDAGYWNSGNRGQTGDLDGWRWT